MEDGQLVQSMRLNDTQGDGLGLDDDQLYEHDRIAFPSYPGEWPPEMLAAAGKLTLELFERALEEGFGLKDATPYNVLFRGSRPVFVDVLSFEHRDPLDATWIAYAQFVRTFLLPLAAWRYFGLSTAAVFTSHRDGLEPETVYHWAGFRHRLTPPFLGLVSIPKWLSTHSSATTYSPKQSSSAEKARFILDRLLASCSKQLVRLSPRPGADSVWSEYLDHKSLYTPNQLAQKEAFVREVLEQVGARTVLDVGANEGRFSFLAARQGSSVVAIDTDPVVVGRIWSKASQEGLDVLPLVVDLTRPTPATGWRNQECESFLDRAVGGFDLVMMLAVIHHVLVTERVPLDNVLGLVEDLTRDYALIEFVAPQDPMFERLVRGRETLYSHLTLAAFEAAAARRFELVKSLKLDGLYRCLYLLRRRQSGI